MFYSTFIFSTFLMQFYFHLRCLHFGLFMSSLVMSLMFNALSFDAAAMQTFPKLGSIKHFLSLSYLTACCSQEAGCVRKKIYCNCAIDHPHYYILQYEGRCHRVAQLIKLLFKSQYRLLQFPNHRKYNIC